MPRIMTMNGDHQTVATAPLDLSTNNRERGSAGSRTPDCRGRARDARVTAGSPAAPACTGTVSLGIHSPTVRNAPGSQTGAARKRPTDTSPSKLPLRKRPFPLEPDPHSQSPTPSESGDRFSPAEDTDLTFRESVAGRLERAADESSVSAAPVTPAGSRVCAAPETPAGSRVCAAPETPAGSRVCAAPVTPAGSRVCAAPETPAGSRVCVAPVTPVRTEDTGHGYHLRFVHQFNYMYGFPPVPEPNPHLAHQTENLLTDIALATHQDEDGDTALHIAVVQGELAIVWKLIHILQWARRSLDTYNNLRQTPLHLAVITQQTNVVDVLLNAGADPAALDRNGQTALHLCCEYNQHQCLSVVLDRYSSSTCLEIKNYEGLTPLHLAVLRGHRDLARMLLDAGADINAMDVKSGQSPLMHAVESNNADMVYFLIENGCDVNSQSYSGNTALHAACGRGQVDTVRLLLKNGADSSLKNYHNDTPVMVATNKKIADVLRGRGSKPIRGQDQHAVSVSPHGNTLIENGSPSPNHSRGCSPSTTPHIPHH